MGCSASVVARPHRKPGPVVRIQSDRSQRTSRSLVPWREEDEEADLEGLDNDTLSIASSAGRTISSYVSGVTSLNSRHPQVSKCRSDDIQSDVPTIAESIADMQDLAELTSWRPDNPAFFHSMSSNSEVRQSIQGSSFNMSDMMLDGGPREVIDNRPHPLAPVTFENTTEASQNTVVADLGGLSDVPSVRDDISTASSTDEILVLFPPSASLPPCRGSSHSPSCNSSEHGNGTPTSSHRLGQPQTKLTRSLHLALRESEARRRRRCGSMNSTSSLVATLGASAPGNTVPRSGSGCSSGGRSFSRASSSPRRSRRQGFPVP